MAHFLLDLRVPVSCMFQCLLVAALGATASRLRVAPSGRLAAEALLASSPSDLRAGGPLIGGTRHVTIPAKFADRHGNPSVRHGRAPSFVGPAYPHVWSSLRWRQKGVPVTYLDFPVRRRAAKDDERADDFLAGESFSPKARLVFESENRTLEVLLFVCVGLAITGAFGLFYNGIGLIAKLTPGATPTFDRWEVLALQFLAFVGGALGFTSLSARRTKALRLLDSGFAFLSLELEVLDGIGRVKKLREVGKNKQRVLALFCEGDALTASLHEARAYRRRWVTSDVIVVAVCADMPAGFSGKWLAQAKAPQAWRRCFQNWSAAGASDGSSPAGIGGSWLLFGKSGRIRGSGLAANFDEILGFLGTRENLSVLPPRAPVLSEGEPREAYEQVLEVHDAFYKALIDGDNTSMMPLWVPRDDASEEDELAKQRVPWQSVLSEGAAVLDVLDVDIVFTGPARNEAIVTSIEICGSEPQLLNERPPDNKGSLLATKRLRRIEGAHDGISPWRLLSHQTIPYCRNTLAVQSLRCTRDGCVLFKPGGG